MRTVCLFLLARNLPSPCQLFLGGLQDVQALNTLESEKGTQGLNGLSEKVYGFGLRCQKDVNTCYSTIAISSGPVVCHGMLMWWLV